MASLKIGHFWVIGKISIVGDIKKKDIKYKRIVGPLCPLCIKEPKISLIKECKLVSAFARKLCFGHITVLYESIF